jgi:hypothetical protein
MNLVKAQEYAQSLPLAELKKYADGLNPSMIPPWLATGEMQAKTKRAEMANALQGAATGEQPSVKEQVEQKAGLLGLQMAQQRATQQQMMEPRPMRGPVPTGTPQPEAQPRPTQMAGLNQLQSNIKMAGGGIVAFAAGDKVKAGPEFIKFLRNMGIDYTDFVKSSAVAQDNIKDMFRAAQGSQPAAQAAPAAQTVQGNASPKAFQVGQKARPMLEAAGQSIKGKAIPVVGAGLSAYEGLSGINDAKDFYDDSNVPTTEKAKQFLRTASKTALPYVGGAVGSGIAPVAGTIGGAAVGQGLASLIDQEGDALKKYRAGQAAGQVSNQSPAETARLKATTPASDMGTEGRRAAPVAMGNGINVSPNLIPASARPKPPAVPQNVNPNATKVNPNAPPAAPAAPAPDSYDAMLMNALKNSPKERSIESIIAEQNAIQKGLGLDEPAGKNKLDRIAEIKRQYAATQLSPMDELIAMLGKSGQSKGLSGLAPAYTSMAEKKRAADLAHAERINELMGGVEDTQRAEKVATSGKVGTAREKDVENTRLFDREKLSTLGTVRGQDLQADVTKRGQDMTYRAAMAAAAQRGDNQEIAKINAASQLAARDETINGWQTAMKELLKIPSSANRAKIAALEKQINDRTKAIYGQFGITIPEAPGAASPGGTTRVRFDAQGNQIK